MQHPYVSMAHKSWQAALKIAQEYGFTSLARSKISMPQQSSKNEIGITSLID
jgi:phage terminase small subunit